MRYAEYMDVPTVLRHGQWRFFFYSNEGTEPPHIHVTSAAGGSRSTAKFLLMPVRMVRSRGLSAHELRRIGRFVIEREQEFVRAWNEHFSADQNRDD
jgi:hypothetical protein